jgi:CRISPR-associated protein Cmr4
MNSRILMIFTRTPLHVGAGSSVGAIDQPIVRERHTGFPVIPASSLKGTFADAWNGSLENQDRNRFLRVTTRKDDSGKEVLDKVTEAAWLFGSDNAKHAFAGAIQFSEARLLAFPIRSARGSFAWITCPLMLARGVRDGVLEDNTRNLVESLMEPEDDKAAFALGKLDLDVAANGGKVKQVVLEEYTFTRTGGEEAAGLGTAMAGLLKDDGVWAEVKDRLVILSNGMMSYFARTACDVAQHVRISDETGTAADGALFNQENVPSEAMFYLCVNIVEGRGDACQGKAPDNAWDAFSSKLDHAGHCFQFGGDASTGLGYCTVKPFNGQGGRP